MLEDKIKIVTITLTQNCNLSCTYCYEHNKSQKILSFDIAKEIIDTELRNLQRNEILEFDLFGGEPFLEFELLKRITEYICENKDKKQCRIFATTNGTLLLIQIIKSRLLN